MKTLPLLLALLVWSLRLSAAIDITMTQVGSDVVVTGSGIANLVDLTYVTDIPGNGGIQPDSDALLTGSADPVTLSVYSGVSGLTSFGSGPQASPDSGSGDVFGFLAGSGFLILPTGYVSSSSISGTSTYTGQTLASLGITPGVYTGTWGSGPNVDSITFTAAIPEPHNIALLGLGIIILSSLRLHKRLPQHR